MDPHDQPWSEHERVNLLAEILLKAGTSPSRVLFAAIRDSGIQVRWNDLVLPNGESSLYAVATTPSHLA
jgi:nicotinamide mononucleotide adenylyltransferase